MERNEEDLAIVKDKKEDSVLIEIIRNEGCSSCGMNGFCGGKNHSFKHWVKTDKVLNIGDVVKINLAAKVKIAGGLLLFIFPIFLMVVFYFGAKALKLSENGAILVSLCGLLAAGVVIRFADRKAEAKINFEIIEVVESHDPQGE